MDDTEAVTALTHHAIFSLAEPVARAGYPIDVAASDCVETPAPLPIDTEARQHG